MIAKIIIFIIIFSIMLLTFLFFFLKDRYIFLKKEESYDILCKNYEFYDRFMDVDLKVRNVKNIKEYIIKIEDDLYNFSLKEKIKLIYSSMKADKMIEKIKYPWFDGEKASKIKWIFSCIGKYYESGFPHTVMGKYIMIPREIIFKYNDKELTSTLIHEKVHLYQYRYKEDIKRYLSERDIKVYKKRDIEDNIRVNPDTDEFIYKKGEIYYKAKFKENPKKMYDVIFYNDKYEYEHPFEEMAIYISNMSNV